MLTFGLRPLRMYSVETLELGGNSKYHIAGDVHKRRSSEIAGKLDSGILVDVHSWVLAMGMEMNGS